LTDLSGYSPEDIQHTKAGLLINALLALQYGNNVNFIRKHFSIFFHDENGSLNEDSNRNFIQLIIVYLFKNNEFSTVESKQLLATISEPIKKKVMNTYDRIIAEGFKLKEYEVVKKAYNKKYPAAEIAELLDISIEKVKSIIEAIKKEGEN
jgi:hypothetical protein